MLNFLRNFLEKNHKHHSEDLRDKIEDLIEESEESVEKGAEEKLDRNELSLVSNVLKLRDLTVGDIMIPRTEIVSAQATTSLKEFMEIFTKSGYSQIPVYSDTLDNVVGVVRIRDFLPYVLQTENFKLDDILRDVFFVVPSMLLLELLVEMRTTQRHMALIVDEFGGVDGLVTLEDVVSKIVGEIERHQILPKFLHRYDGSFLVDAKYSLVDCATKLGVDLLKPLTDDEGDAPDIDTVGGLVAYLAGKLPQKGEVIKHPSNVNFEVVDADPRRIKQVIIRYGG